MGRCENMQKYVLQATESAPKMYPMKIIRGDLYFYGQDGSLYVPDGVFLHNGWGDGRSSHVVGDDKKPLPDRLHILFFSYTENQFYEGDFKLPYEKISRLFQEGFYSPNEGGHVTYHDIVVGVAPGGVVCIWLWELEKRTEVFFGQAKKIEGNWGWVNNNSNYTRKEYVKLGIEDALGTKEAIEEYEKHGVPFGLWSKYHEARYHWVPQFTNLPLYDSRITQIDYFNGERDYLSIPLNKNIEKMSRAVPEMIVLIWKRSVGKPLKLKLFFEEEAIFGLFKKINKPGQTLRFEFRITEINGKHDLSIWLHNDTESAEFKNFRMETYGIPDRVPEPYVE